jgi:hypothetical protein
VSQETLLVIIEAPLESNVSWAPGRAASTVIISISLDCLNGETFVAGDVILHSMQSHLSQYGDGGNTLGKLQS